MKSLLKAIVLFTAAFIFSCAPAYAQRRGGHTYSGHSYSRSSARPMQRTHTTARNNTRVPRTTYRGRIEYNKFYSYFGYNHRFTFDRHGYYGIHPCFWYGGFQFWYTEFPIGWGYYDQFYIVYGVDPDGNPIYYLYDVNFPGTPIVVNVFNEP